MDEIVQAARVMAAVLVDWRLTAEARCERTVT